MNLLIITQSYPGGTKEYSPTYIHTRLLYYKQQNIYADVISFKCKKAYDFEGIKVYPAKSFSSLLKENSYNAVISHAPNIRNHIRLLMRNFPRLPKVFFQFHGHEILNKSRYYPQDFDFNQGAFYGWYRKFIDIYDSVKCFLLRQIIKKFGGKKIFLIFVSQYLTELFEKNIGLRYQDVEAFSAIIPNPIHSVFTQQSYDWSANKIYDFITIRKLDNPVHAVDEVVRVAEQNPQFSFHIYGIGKYFDYNHCPGNVKVINSFVKPEAIPNLLNSYKAALMPSHHDTQGVMVCEMAAFGIPVITSDIPAAREVLKGVKNKLLISNDNIACDLNKFIRSTRQQSTSTLRDKLSAENTAHKEVSFIREVVGKRD